MADFDRNDRRYRGGEHERSQRMRDMPDYGQTDYSADYETDYSRGRSYGRQRDNWRREERGDHRFAPFGSAGPVEGRDGVYDDQGERYGGYRRNEYRGEGRGRDDRNDPRWSAPGRHGDNPYPQSHDPHYDAPYGMAYTDDDGRRGRMEHRARETGREARSWWDRTTDRIGSALTGDDDRRDRDWGDRGESYRGGYREAGAHRGRGPKGYRRSDDRIREDVSDRLADDPYLDASEIEVQVSEAEVTLTGSVPRRGDKRRAEALAESISGVTHVQNNLRAQNNDRDDDERYDWTRGLMWGAPF